MELLLRSTYFSAALSLLYILLLYRSHPFRRLPSPATIVAFVAGMVSVLLVIVFREIVPIPPIATSLGILVAAAALEEGVKVLVASLTVFRLRFPDVAEPLDVALYLGIIGVGFGIYEDFWYIFATSYPAWAAGDAGHFSEVFGGVVLARALPGHILFNAIAGVLFGLAVFQRGRRRCGWALAGFGLAVGLHAGFNLLAGRDEPILLLVYVVLLIGVFIGLRRWVSAQSPFARVIRHLEEGESWIDSRGPTEYLLAEGFAWPAKARGGFFQFYPVLLSLAALFPILILAIYSVTWALTAWL